MFKKPNQINANQCESSQLAAYTSSFEHDEPLGRNDAMDLSQ